MRAVNTTSNGIKYYRVFGTGRPGLFDARLSNDKRDIFGKPVPNTKLNLKHIIPSLTLKRKPSNKSF
jgi:hypothetical protein